MALGLAIGLLAAGKRTELDKVLKGKHMSEVTAQAAAQLAEFEQKRDPFCIQNASDLLEKIDLATEQDGMKRLVLRRETLETWLALVAILDQNLDPRFNPEVKPSVSVMPPRVGNVAYPPGVDPKQITDPQARQQYEAELKKNKEYAETYRVQTWLKRFDESMPPKVEKFIRMSYTTVPGDQREVSETVRKLIKNPQRASKLTQAAAPKQ